MQSAASALFLFCRNSGVLGSRKKHKAAADVRQHLLRLFLSGTGPEVAGKNRN
jgi:hypothetical protein